MKKPGKAPIFLTQINVISYMLSIGCEIFQCVEINLLIKNCKGIN
jgi:hypothetical protein